MSGSYFRKDAKCLNCNKLLVNKYALRCKVCNGLYNNSMKGKRGLINPNFKHGGKSKCIDCNKEIKIGYKRCHSCSAKYFLNNPEFKIKLKERLKGKGNPMYGRKHSIETIQKILSKTRLAVKSPNKLEKDFIEFLEKNGLSKYKFVGNGKFLIENFNPDFVCKEDRKIIELYGDYWHKNDLKHNRRVSVYSNNDYDTLVIYESEFRNKRDEVLRDILNFEKLEVY